jgi:hypothetical protein
MPAMGKSGGTGAGVSFERRTIVMALLAAAFALSYGVARLYSERLVAFVVLEALVQKAPEMDAADVRRRFEVLGRSLPDDRSRLESYLELSRRIEKVQRVEPGELDRLLAGSTPGRRSRREP